VRYPAGVGTDTHMLLPREATRRLLLQPLAYIDEHGVLRHDDSEERDPVLTDGDVRSVLDRWAHVVSDPTNAAYCLRLQLGSSVADDPGDPRGVYLYPDSVTAVGATYAEALRWLEAGGHGHWLGPMPEDEAERYRPKPSRKHAPRRKRK